MQQALEHPWFDKPSVSLGGIEALDSNDENDTEGEEPEEPEEEVQRSSPAAAPPIQPIPEHSELPEEETASSRNQSRASSRRSSHGDQYQYTPSSSRRGSQGRNA